MKKMMFRSLLFSAAAALALQGFAQDVDYKKYPDYSPVVKADKRLAAPVRRAGETRPAYVNNALTPYFPEVINQDGGSCGSASRIWYMFTTKSMRGAVPTPAAPTISIPRTSRGY